jgi:hypothetical protein
MVHDSLHSDNWWHEYGNEICKLGNNHRIAIRDIDKGDISIDEIKIMLEENLKYIEKSHEIIREVYINDRREELVKNMR